MQEEEETDQTVSLNDSWVQGDQTPWLLWRFEYDPHWRSLEIDEAWAIDQLMQGKSFGEICVGLEHWIDEEHIPLRAVGFLKSLVSQGVVEEFSV